MAVPESTGQNTQGEGRNSLNIVTGVTGLSRVLSRVDDEKGPVFVDLSRVSRVSRAARRAEHQTSGSNKAPTARLQYPSSENPPNQQIKSHKNLMNSFAKAIDFQKYLQMFDVERLACAGCIKPDQSPSKRIKVNQGCELPRIKPIKNKRRL